METVYSGEETTENLFSFMFDDWKNNNFLENYLYRVDANLIDLG